MVKWFRTKSYDLPLKEINAGLLLYVVYIQMVRLWHGVIQSVCVFIFNALDSFAYFMGGMFHNCLVISFDEPVLKSAFNFLTNINYWWSKGQLQSKALSHIEEKNLLMLIHNFQTCPAFLKLKLLQWLKFFFHAKCMIWYFGYFLYYFSYMRVLLTRFHSVKPGFHMDRLVLNIFPSIIPWFIQY